VIATLTGGEVDAAKDLGKEFSVEIRKENAERMSFSGAETARAAVRGIAESSRHIPNSSAGFLANGICSAENPRHCRNGYVGLASYILDRNHQVLGPDGTYKSGSLRLTPKNVIVYIN
jgi:hypothetical protein